jgi:hypothetical protein
MLWMNFAVRPGFSWPNTPVEIPVDAATVVLSPETSELACTASLFDASGFEFDEGATRLSKFLSRLAWSQRGAIEEHFAVGTNNPKQPGRLGKGTYAMSGWATVDPWHQLYLPAVPTPDAGLSLALFREGMSLNSEPLRFLSLFKVLNIVFSSGPKQQQWINSNLHRVKGGPELERLSQLQAQHRDIGEYLYVQGRCAVAHAYSTPVADPDDYADRRRLRDDLPLIRLMAELCIERELNVPTTDSFLAAHRNSRILPPQYLVPSPGPSGRVRYLPPS